jgi:hypothetical protein
MGHGSDVPFSRQTERFRPGFVAFPKREGKSANYREVKVTHDQRDVGVFARLGRGGEQSRTLAQPSAATKWLLPRMNTNEHKLLLREEACQVLNYLKITQFRVGLILNFKKPKLEWE